MQLSSNLHPAGTINHQASMDAILEPQLPISDSLKLVGKIWGTQALTGERKTDMQDVTLGATLRKPLVISSALGYLPSISTLFPASYASREEASLRLAVGMTHRLILKAADILNLSYRAGLTRYFFEFSTAASGSANPEWRLLHRGDLEWSISDRLKLAIAGIVSSYWSYEGNPWTSFEGVQELSFQWSEQVSLAMGHSNSGSAFKPNGVDSNVALFDNESSTVYGGVTVSF